jgi:polar amino acid transport system substrate-binding protein
MEDRVKTASRLLASVLACVLVGCASQGTTPTAQGASAAAAAPTSQTRQELAPSGQLRVAFISGALYATKDAATGDLKGVAVDLGRSLAQRLGVPFQPVVYPNPAAILAAAKSGEWDVALMGINPERAAVLDFSSPYMDVEQGYLVRSGLPVGTAAEVDRAGVRIAVIEKGGADLHLSSTLKNATLVRAKTIGELDAMLDAGSADVVAATKTSLYERAAARPGTRVLDGRILVEPLGMGVPKGRGLSVASYIDRFVQESKAAGLVGSAIERAGLRGVVVSR